MAKYVELDKIMQFPIRRDHYDRENGNEHFINGIESVMEYIEMLPTIDAVPVRHGKWEERTDNDDHYVYCSECGDEYIENDLRLDSWVKRYFKYCPNCGARMDEE